MIKSMIRENKGILLVLSGVFVLMLFLNSMTPLFADDYIYLLNLHTEKPIDGFADVVSSVSGFRNIHNGRVAAHFFAQLFLWLPKTVFVIVNAAMCTGLVLLVYRYIRSGNKNKDAVMTACAFAMIWVLMMGFGHAMLWRTGACSYLWAAVFLSMFIYPFFGYYMFESGGHSEPVSMVLGIAFAFFAGSYSESGAFSALAIVFCFLALIFLRERKLPVGLLLRFVSACAGFLWLMLAPSELGKKNVNANSQTVEQLGKLGIDGKVLLIALLVVVLATAVVFWGLKYHRRKFSKIMALTVTALVVAVTLVTAFGLEGTQGLLSGLNALVSDTLLGIVFLFGTYAVIMCMYLSQEKIETKVIFAAGVFGLGALASVLIFVLADYFPARASCVTTVYLTIANLLLLSPMYDKCRKKVFRPCAAILIAAFVLCLIAGCADIVSIGSQYQQRKEVIAEAQAADAEKIDLAPLLAQGKYGVTWQGEAFDYFNAMEIYYGINRIRVEGAKYW